MKILNDQKSIRLHFCSCISLRVHTVIKNLKKSLKNVFSSNEKVLGEKNSKCKRICEISLTQQNVECLEKYSAFGTVLEKQ